jgi:glutamine synthetase
MKIESLPGSLEEALWCMKNSLIARVALGKHIVDEFVTAKEIEWEAYRTYVSQ